MERIWDGNCTKMYQLCFCACAKKDKDALNLQEKVTASCLVKPRVERVEENTKC